MSFLLLFVSGLILIPLSSLLDDERASRAMLVLGLSFLWMAVIESAIVRILSALGAA
jgi:hypothetical protein